MEKTSYWIAKVIYVICIVIIILYGVAKFSGILSRQGAFTDSVFTVGTDILTKIMPLEYAFQWDFSNPSYPTIFVFICVIPVLLICRRRLLGLTRSPLPPLPPRSNHSVPGE